VAEFFFFFVERLLALRIRIEGRVAELVLSACIYGSSQGADSDIPLHERAT
jgi:hypothetical protein